VQCVGRWRCNGRSGTPGFDLLRVEGLAYGEKREQAGVAMDVKLYTILVHPFINVAGCVPAARLRAYL